jgi:hypothetical protein
MWPEGVRGIGDGDVIAAGGRDARGRKSLADEERQEHSR